MGKPPSSRHLVPHRGTSDYEEDDATTLDPFVIHDNELVVVRKPGGTDDMREELRADPDVQDALRWLDPPSNIGPPMAQVAPEPPPPEPPPPDPAAHYPPMRHPSAPAYPQVYTPVPQPMPPGYPPAGHYPTPVPTYVPNSGAYYLTTPMPPAPAPAPARSPVPWILLTALVTGGGIALGWWLFAGRYQFGSASQPAAKAPVQQPVPVAQPAPQPPPQPTPQPTPVEKPTAPPVEPAAPQSVTAIVSSVTSSKSIEVPAPLSGQVGKIFVAKSGKVAKGDKLMEISHQTDGGAKAKKLAARVAELERLAKDDPVYEDFLADARKDLKAAKGRPEVRIVEATAAGEVELAVTRGQDVAGGKPVARISSGGDLIIKATAQGEVQRSWTCNLAMPDGKRAACKIDKVIASATGSDITATVSGQDAPWLKDVSQKPTLILDPS